MATHIEMAIEAINQVKHIQSCNTWGAKITDSIGLTNHGQNVGVVQSQRGVMNYGQAPYISSNYARIVKEKKFGNCEDKTRVAYDYLCQKYAYMTRFHLCSSRAFDHAFLIIHNSGKISHNNDYDKSDFGADAVLVDAWQHDYYYLNGYPSLNPFSWLIGPQQGITRFLIWNGRIHTQESMNTV